jgi:hypothetical protein
MSELRLNIHLVSLSTTLHKKQDHNTIVETMTLQNYSCALFVAVWISASVIFSQFTVADFMLSWHFSGETLFHLNGHRTTDTGAQEIYILCTEFMFAIP